MTNLIIDEIIESDICIIGAGAAGITLARQFRDQPFRAVVLESGGLTPASAAQALCFIQLAATLLPHSWRTRPSLFA